MLFSKSAKTDITDEALPASSANSIDDDADLAAMGYKSEFKREFTNLGTISFAFSIM